MIYLIHFQRPLHHARHYLGFVSDRELARRMERHRSGDGARLLRALGKAGIDWKVARTWEGGTRDQERKLKNRKKARRLCPVCMGEVKYEDLKGG